MALLDFFSKRGGHKRRSDETIDEAYQYDLQYKMIFDFLCQTFFKFHDYYGTYDFGEYEMPIQGLRFQNMNCITLDEIKALCLDEKGEKLPSILLTEDFPIAKRLRQVTKSYYQQNLREFAEAPHTVIVMCYRKYVLETIYFLASQEIDEAFEKIKNQANKYYVYKEVSFTSGVIDFIYHKGDSLGELFEIAKKMKRTIDDREEVKVLLKVEESDFDVSLLQLEKIRSAVKAGKMTGYFYPIRNPYGKTMGYYVYALEDRSCHEEDSAFERYYSVEEDRALGPFCLADSELSKKLRRLVHQMICDSVPGDYLFREESKPIRLFHMKQVYVTEERLAALTEYKGEVAKGLTLEIPKEIDGYKIWRLDKNCFRGLQELEAVKLTESIKYIEMGAFEDCTGLKELIIPKTVERIGAAAFRGCHNLTLVVERSSKEAMKDTYYPWGLDETQIRWNNFF